MARPKKNTKTKATPKKTTAKKPAPRAKPKTTAKKAAAKRTPDKTQLKKAFAKKIAARASTSKKEQKRQETSIIKMLSAKSSPRRPPKNDEMPMEYIEDMQESFAAWRDDLDGFAAHLRALDRKRLNGVGLKKLGFIERALQLASENPEFLPHYLSLRKFQQDNNYFFALRSVFDIIRQIQEILWNIIIEASDVLYTDALEYYAGVREAAKRRVDPAETIFSDLFAFFKRGSRTSEEPTEKELKRDANALLHGKRDGKIVIENIRPKLSGGKHQVIDETFKDSARFKESEEGEITG